MILILDNYDSFTYNLLQYLGEVTSERVPISVKRNDAITINDIRALSPQQIIISPGPCTPYEAGISIELIRTFTGKIPILGVCLGHQAIGAAFGAKICRSHQPMHGKTSIIRHTGKSIFSELPTELTVGRYHSLIIERETFPSELEVIAQTKASESDNAIPAEIMAIRHKVHISTIGLQFHPESILTPSGKKLLSQFLNHA